MHILFLLLGGDISSMYLSATRLFHVNYFINYSQEVFEVFIIFRPVFIINKVEKRLQPKVTPFRAIIESRNSWQ